MKEIKPSACTQFPVGCKVKIVDKGQTCSTYRDMAKYLGIGYDWTYGLNPFCNGDIGVVVAKAMHEENHYGEVLAVRVGGDVGLIVAEKGVVEYEEPVVIGKPKLHNYEHAPLTPHATERLSKYFAKAPAWATHVGSDSTGVHYFDHHPHEFKCTPRMGVAFLKGLLPSSYHSLTQVRTDTTETLETVVIVRPAPEPTTEEQLEALKVELAETKAKLWEAEWKLRKMVEVAQEGIL